MKIASIAWIALISLLPPRAIAVPQDEQLRTDSRAPYVHRITLYDHHGVAISPDDPMPEPYSPARTCGKCHPVAQVGGGWHFNADDERVDPGRPGEPWIVHDARTGTVLPVSARGWPGTFTPESIGLSNWQFAMRFGRHVPGGGLAEPSAEAIADSTESLRWGISGGLEIDCMVCHSADMRHDPAEISRQIERENFKWSPTAALGLAVVRGEAKSMPDDWDPLLPPSPDFPEQQPPSVLYDAAVFDADDRVRFDVTRRPPPARCDFCHTVRQVGDDAAHGWSAAEDVHLRAGMVCTDCHRNDIGHQIVRGYRDEAVQRGDASVAIYSCEGCHLGVTGAAESATALGGTYGAPRPAHRGIPPVHFERMTCTACHSGPWPETSPRRVQTAMAHALGIASKHRADNDPPEIVEPIFAADERGRIAPHRMIWPAHFAWIEGDAVSPLPLDVVKRAAEAALPSRTGSMDEQSGDALDETQVAAVLAELRRQLGDREGEPVRVADGYVLRSDGAGAELERIEHAAARPYLWPIGHQVRPASQSLGVRGCDDCHAPDAPLFFGAVSRADSASTVDVERPITAMFELQGVDESLVRTWARSFRFRPAYKWLTFGAVGLVAAVLLVYGLRGLAAILRRFG